VHPASNETLAAAPARCSSARLDQKERVFRFICLPPSSRRVGDQDIDITSGVQAAFAADLGTVFPACRSQGSCVIVIFVE
jgi:hypothetical protein